MTVIFIKHDIPEEKVEYFDVVDIHYDWKNRTVTIVDMFGDSYTYNMRIWNMKALAK